MEPTDRPTRPAEPPARDESLVELGPIVNRHGIRGELRLLLHNPESDAALTCAEVVVRWPDGRREARRVRGARRHKRFALLQLAGVDDATAAETLIGCTVSVPRAALPPAGDDAVYHADLLGCAVVTTAGEALGTVREILVTGSNDVCVVRDATREVLVPMVADVIAEIDVAGRRLIVRPLPGLFDDGE
ncbi:MAG TPA: ribosome maturation factor RimM [Candidatus Dormibacteraeota bacterium]|nr:ribosome maturation factor RimM [Candidatus Dormibacteraeota bacterium]